MCADDILIEEALKRLYRGLESRPQAMAAFAKVWSETPNRNTCCCFHPLIGVPCLRPGPREV